MGNQMLPMRTTHIGYRHGQLNAQNEYHPGYDLNYGKPQEDNRRIVVDPGIPLEVVHVDRQPYYGRTLVLRSPEQGLLYRFMHLSQIIPDVGDKLNPEDPIARCGDDDGSVDHRWHVGMTAHLHHDVMREAVLKKLGFNVMTWGRSVRNKTVFDDLYVDLVELYPALARLMQTAKPWELRSANGEYVNYLRP